MKRKMTMTDERTEAWREYFEEELYLPPRNARTELDYVLAERMINHEEITKEQAILVCQLLITAGHQIQCKEDEEDDDDNNDPQLEAKLQKLQTLLTCCDAIENVFRCMVALHKQRELVAAKTDLEKAVDAVSVAQRRVVALEAKAAH
jgi:hypothetical protein